MRPNWSAQAADGWRVLIFVYLLAPTASPSLVAPSNWKRKQGTGGRRRCGGRKCAELKHSRVGGPEPGTLSAGGGGSMWDTTWKVRRAGAEFRTSLCLIPVVHFIVLIKFLQRGFLKQCVTLLNCLQKLHSCQSASLLSRMPLSYFTSDPRIFTKSWH